MSILVVGEYPSLNEEQPFSNGFWRFFKLKLAQAGIPPAECFYLNVVNKPSGSIYPLVQESRSGSASNIGMIGKKKYLRPEFASDVDLLRSNIKRIAPNLVLAVGDLALVALTGAQSVDVARGRITTMLEACGGGKVLPMLHPSTVMSNESFAPIYMADMQKAKREAAFKGVRRPQRFLHLRPSVEDLEGFWQDYITPAPVLSIDIETKGHIITCVGVAPSRDRAIVVPFFDEERPSGNYWDTQREEKIAWDFIRRCCAAEGKAVLGQNFSFDAQKLWRKMGIPVPSWRHDTMILHHALQMEMRKSLGFLASIYTDELAWKFLAKRRSDDKSGKKEDE